MPLSLAGIYVVLGIFTAAYTFVLLPVARRTRPTPGHLLTGFVTNFFDTLGIGSFATTTTIFRFTGMVPTRLIPGTLNAGHTLPVIMQAFIYLTAISVEPLTLSLLMAGAVVGGWCGAALVAGLSKRAVQLCMGGTLLIAAAVMLMRQFALFPAGGDALGLSGWPLAIGVLGNLLFGAISTLGIGFYAPCMTMVSLLGMNPAAAFPIMMGSGALLMPAASAQFVKRQAFSPVVAWGLTLGGLAGVPLAAFLVKSLPLDGLRWLVIVVVLYAAVLMLRSGDSE